MRIQRPTITAPTITQVQSLAGTGANITGSFQGAFDGTLTGATFDTLAPKASPTFTGTVAGVTATHVGLGNVDNTSDADKPVSTAQQTESDTKADIASPTFTGTVSGITSTMVGLGNANNTSDANKPVSTAQQTEIDTKADIASPTFTGTVAGIDKSMIGLGNADNTSDANKPISNATQTEIDTKADLASPTFTGTVAGISQAMVGLGNVTNESKATLFTDSEFTGTPLSTTPNANDSSTKVATTAYVQQELTDLVGGAGAAYDTLLEISASIANGDSDVVALTTTVGGKLQKDQNLGDLTDAAAAKTNLTLNNVDNTSDANKPVSTAGQTALDLKANLASPTFTGTVAGVTATHVGLGNASNTSDADKPVSTAGQTALDLKANLADPTFTGTVAGITKTMVGLGSADDTSDADKPVSTAGQTALDLKANLAGPTFTGTVAGISATMVGLGTTDHAQFHCLGIGTAASTVTGEIRATGDITAYYSSDERLKENFSPLAGALDKVKAIGGYEFDWKDGIEDATSKTGHDIGVKAQEVQAQYPDLVHERDNGYLAVDYIKLNAVLIEAIKELSAKVDELSK